MNNRLKTQNSTPSKGYSLTELLVIVVIVGVLARIAMPSYQEYMQRGWRSDARSVLLSNAQFMARYFSQNFKYRASGVAPTLPITTSPDGSSSVKYNITVSTSDDSSFTLTATPSGWTDSSCGSLTLNQTGYRSATAASGSTAISNCWQR